MGRISYSRRTFIRMGSGLALTLTGSVPYAYPGASEPTIDDLKKMLTGNRPLVWLFTGDSITQGAKHTHGMRSYPEIFTERLRWELGRMRDVVINTGISGNTTLQILDDFDWRIKQFQPAVVSVMAGTNDCALAKNISTEQFRKNLELLITRIRAIGALPVLHTPTPILADKTPERKRLPQYTAVCREVAGNAGLLLVDHARFWEEQMNRPEMDGIVTGWLNDPIHPNGAGHLQMARLLFQVLGIYDEHAPTINGHYYGGDHGQ